MLELERFSFLVKIVEVICTAQFEQSDCQTSQVFRMKNEKRIPFLPICAGLAVGIGAGVVASFVLFPLNEDEQFSGASTPLTDSTELEITDNRSNSTTDLASVLKLDAATDRRLAVYRLLEGLSGQEIANILRDSFKLDSSEHLHTVQTLLFAALAHRDPEFSLELVWESARANRHDFLTIVIAEWASSDPEAAMQFASALTEPWKSNAFRSVLQTRQDLSDAQQLDLAESFGATAILDELTFTAEFEEVLDEPQTAFELVLKANIPDFRKSELVTLITQRWIEREDTDDFGSMLSLVYEQFSEEQYQWRVVVSALAATDPRLVWEQLLTLSLDAQKMLNDVVFKAWVKQDPIGAVSALNDSNHMSTESWELNALYAEWATAVWHELPQQIDLIPVDYRTNSLTIAVRNVATRIGPNELLKQLEEIQKKGVNTKSTLERYLNGLSSLDPAAAVQLASEYLEEGNYVISSLLQDLAVVDATKAMEIALQQPVSGGAEQSVVQALFSQGWLEQGLELLPKVRKGTSATNLYASAGALMIDNGRISEAIELAKKLSEEDRPEYFERLAGRWAYKDINAFLPVLSEIPSAEIQSRVAEYLLRMDVYTGNLTDDEIETVRSFVQVSAD